MARNVTEDRDRTNRTTPVDGEIIHDVAKRHGMGAGALKGLLQGLDDGEDLEDLTGRDRDACRDALEKHAEEAVQDSVDAWEGERAYSEEFDRIVTVSCVYTPHADEVLDGYVPVDVLVDNGDRRYTETTTLDTLTAVESISLEIEGDAAEAHELLEVLEAGIEAVEFDDLAALADEGDPHANFARLVRKAVYNQHNRIDNSLTARGGR